MGMTLSLEASCHNPDQQALALPFVEIERAHGSQLGGLRVCRFDKPEKVSTVAADQ
jgi:hypothetical protein